MKKFILLFLVAFLAAARGMALTNGWKYEDYDFEKNGLYYYITNNGTDGKYEVCVTHSFSGKGYTGDIVIPYIVRHDNHDYMVNDIEMGAFGKSDDQITYVPSSSITSVVLSDGFTRIPDYAFCDCSTLKSVTIPNSVTSIGESAFVFCSALTSVTIPNSVTSIGFGAFHMCPSLTSISVDAANTVYDSRNNCNAIIRKSNNELVAGCKNTVIPASVTSIGAAAFRGCSGLTSVVIPSSVTNIGNYAFWDCSYLTSVDIPSSVTSIGRSAFQGCSSLMSIVIPSSVTSIDRDAFNGCTGLTSVVIPSSVTSIGISVFQGCSGLTSVVIPSSVTSIGYLAFQGCSGLTSIVIPSSVTSISYDAFVSCSGLTSISVDAGNTVYDSRNNCNAIIGKFSNRLVAGCKNTVIPSSVTSIGESAFRGCSGLTSIVIPSSVTSIGTNAFSRCSGLTSVVIPSSVTSIKYGAFENCSKLKSLTFFGVPEEVDTYAIPAATIVYVPRDIYDAAVAKFTKNTVKLIPDTNVEEYDDILYVKEAELRRGATSSVLLKMKNSVDVTGFQLDMHLPTGMSLAVDEFGDPMIELAGTRTNEKRHTVTWKKQSDDVWRVVCSSMSNQTFAGNDGEVLKIFLDVPANAEERNYDFIITNIELSHPDNTRHTIDHAQYSVNVVSYTLGDVNDDGEITVSDVTGTVNLILNTNTDGLNRRAADINGDHDITITDAAGVVNMVLSAPVKSALRTPRYGSEGFLCVESSVAVPGHTFEVPIALSSTADEYAGMQFDLVLPAGLRLADANGDRRHQLAFAQQADGSERIASLSTSNATYSGNGTTVVTLILEADASFTGGDIRIEGVELVRPDLSSTKPASVMAFIGVEGPTGITTAESAAKSSTVYDLQGRRATVSHGIGISGHRKSINK